MKWNKPKKTVQSILVYLGVISLVITSITSIIIAIWVTYPNAINSFDKKVPDFYASYIKGVYNTTESFENKEVKLVIFKYLYEKLKDITPLEQFYNYKQDSNEYLINYYLENNDAKKALEISKYWENNSPNDFNAKFSYIKVLTLLDRSKASEYCADLYSKYNNIEEVVQAYVLFLIANNEISKAVIIENEFNKSNVNSRITFMLFYIDNKETIFNGKQVVALKHNKQRLKDKIRYTIELNQKFNSLKGLRLDIDSALIGAKVSNVKISIQKDEILYENIKVKPIHSITNLKDEYFVIDGTDPHVKIVLPDDIKNKNGNYKISISLDIIDEIELVQQEFLNNKEWRIFYDTGKSFNEEEFKNITLTREKSYFLYKSNVKWKNVKSIRFDLPSFIGLNVENLSIMLNDKITLDYKKVNSMHGLILKEGKFLVNAKDPYLIIQLESVIDIDSINLSMQFKESNE